MLRALAIILVVGYHADLPLLKGGFIGVDIFFVISGYLITALLVKEGLNSGRINLFEFYARRARRLLPASLVMVLITTLVAIFVLPPIEQMSVSKAALSTIAYLSNIFLAHAATDYFNQTAANNPLLHTWSLAVEEQFYFFWPLLVLAAVRVRRSKTTVAYLILLVGGASLIVCIWLTGFNKSLAFFLSPTRAWEFAAGGLASLIPTNKLNTGHKNYIRGFGLGLLCLAVAFFSSQMNFPGSAAIIPVLGSAMILIAGASTKTPFARSKSGRMSPFQYLGAISYSWYLWHWPVLILGQRIFYNPFKNERILLVLISLAFATLSYHFVENPIRFNLESLKSPLNALTAAFAATVACCWLCLIWQHEIKNSSQFQAFARIVNDQPALYRQGCRADFTESTPIECVFGETQKPSATLVLFGDSHAAQWFPPLVQISNKRRWQLITFIKSSCPAMNLPSYNAALGREETECGIWRNRVLNEISKIKPTAVVVGSFSKYVQPKRPDLDLTSNQWESGTYQTLSRLSFVAKEVIVMRDTPVIGINVPFALAEAEWKHRPKPRAPELSRTDSESVFKAEKAAGDHFANVTFIDLSGAICETSSCSLVKDGLVVYRDQNHLSASFARYLTPYLADALVPVVFREH